MSRKDIAIAEMKIEKWYSQRGLCPSCGEPVAVMESELAHKIPKRKWCLAKWGPKVLHHRLNLVLTHPKCNDAVSIANHPLECERLARVIQVALDE